MRLERPWFLHIGSLAASRTIVSQLRLRFLPHMSCFIAIGLVALFAGVCGAAERALPLFLVRAQTVQTPPPSVDPAMICGSGAVPIRPGTGVGPIRLGMTASAAAHLLHATIVDSLFYVRDSTTLSTFTYVFPEPRPPEPHLFLLAANDRILAITLSWDRAFTESCTTTAGIHLGSPQSAVRDAYGAPPSVLAAALPMNTGIFRIEDYVYDADGIAFSFEPAAALWSRWTPPAVTRLTIFPPRRFCDVLTVFPLLLHDALSCAMFSPQP